MAPFFPLFSIIQTHLPREIYAVKSVRFGIVVFFVGNGFQYFISIKYINRNISCTKTGITTTITVTRVRHFSFCF